MSVEFEVSDMFPVTPEIVYSAWLDSDEHGRMTGDTARVSAVAGEPFEAWGGYIQGRNLELEAGKRILQSWRTSEFEDSEPDSLLEIVFTPEGSATWVKIRHSNLPPNGMQYHQGWIDSYFTPMKEYFNKLVG